KPPWTSPNTVLEGGGIGGQQQGAMRVDQHGQEYGAGGGRFIPTVGAGAPIQQWQQWQQWQQRQQIQQMGQPAHQGAMAGHWERAHAGPQQWGGGQGAEFNRGAQLGGAAGFGRRGPHDGDNHVFGGGH
ncbi:hypothetical protein LTS18_005729, partial [Coniosporium uncinatum]